MSTAGQSPPPPHRVGTLPAGWPRRPDTLPPGAAAGRALSVWAALSVREVLAGAERRLAAAGVPSPRVDAEELLAHVLAVPRSSLAVAGDLPDAAAERFERLLAQRAERIPLQHLTGIAGFRYLELSVGPGVFLPRPETELLAGWAIDRLRGEPSPLVADLCAGSGAIALSIANEQPAADVYAVELDPIAVAWARSNADARVAAGDRPITLLEGDAADPQLLAEFDRRMDLVVTNPPYVPDDAVVDPEVADHDPPLALYGGPDGMDVVRRLIDRAATLLRPGGRLGIEHADLQGELVPAAVRAHGGYTEVEDHRDLNERPRFTTATRR